MSNWCIGCGAEVSDGDLCPYCWDNLARKGIDPEQWLRSGYMLPAGAVVMPSVATVATDADPDAIPF